MIDPVLRVRDLSVEYRLGRGVAVQAVSGVDLAIDRGETIGLVGESGCGKSTLARAIMQLVGSTTGTVELNGVELTALAGDELRRARRAMQIIFQDPVSSLNPSRRVRDIVREGLAIWSPDAQEADLADRVDEAMEAVGLDTASADRRPHEFSGGQCQRICIARALVLEPEVLILDEPVSALDVSVQAQILNLLERLQRRYALAMLFVSHDLAVVKNVSDRVVVMYLGKVCEVAPTEALFGTPRHPYTRALLASIPGIDAMSRWGVDADGALIPGDLPSATSPPSGCRFRTRCPYATERCATEVPELRELVDGHRVACHHAEAIVPSSAV